jgi:2-aminoethylphosphonate-pyruvate transaminase
MTDSTFKEFINLKNMLKPVFTPGPPALSEENLIGLGPAFGRGDSNFQSQLEFVEDWLKELTGKPNLISFQGSGTLACEVALKAFITGRIAVIKSGFYSERLYRILLDKFKPNQVVYKNYSEFSTEDLNFDWVVSCYVETSSAFKLNINELKNLTSKFQAKLFIDATASIGLEIDHKLADVICFSSCKGLFGLTGAAFIAYENSLDIYQEKSFYLNIESHIKKLITGPYHAIQSLVNVIPVHNKMVEAVRLNKGVFMEKFSKFVIHDPESQPVIATIVDCKIVSTNRNAIMYVPRKGVNGTIISHLGESYLKREARGEINNFLEIE